MSTDYQSEEFKLSIEEVPNMIKFLESDVFGGNQLYQKLAGGYAAALIVLHDQLLYEVEKSREPLN